MIIHFLAEVFEHGRRQLAVGELGLVLEGVPLLVEVGADDRDGERQDEHRHQHGACRRHLAQDRQGHVVSIPANSPHSVYNSRHSVYNSRHSVYDSRDSVYIHVIQCTIDEIQ